MLLDTQPYKVPAVTEPIEPWRQLLLDAADLIERTHWWNGKSVARPRPAYCALTAITMAGDTHGVSLAHEAATYFSHYVGIGDQRIPHWNDAPGRTKVEVLAAYDRAIELAA